MILSQVPSFRSHPIKNTIKRDPPTHGYLRLGDDQFGPILGKNHQSGSSNHPGHSIRSVAHKKTIKGPAKISRNPGRISDRKKGQRDIIVQRGARSQNSGKDQEEQKGVYRQKTKKLKKPCKEIEPLHGHPHACFLRLEEMRGFKTFHQAPPSLSPP